MALDRENVMAALRTVRDPELYKDIVTLNMVKDVRVDGRHVHVHVELTTPACPLKDRIKADVEAALRRAGASGVEVELSANTRGSPGGGFRFRCRGASHGDVHASIIAARQ